MCGKTLLGVGVGHMGVVIIAPVECPGLLAWW